MFFFLLHSIFVQVISKKHILGQNRKKQEELWEKKQTVKDIGIQTFLENKILEILENIEQEKNNSEDDVLIIHLENLITDSYRYQFASATTEEEIRSN